MSNIDAIYQKMAYVVNNIPDVIQQKKQEGKKIVGIIPPYVPEELIHAAGMFPVGCWGGQKELSNASVYLPAFACSIAQEITELAADGSYDILDGIITSCACDTLKCTGQNLQKICKHTQIIYCRYPQHNSTAAGKTFFLEELKSCKEKLEQLSGKEITDEALRKSIQIYNENRTAMMDFVEILTDRPEILSAEMRHTIIKSRFYMEKEQHTALMKELNQALKETPSKTDASSIRVILSGIVAEPVALLNLFDELNIAVVGDELIQESRQFRTLVPEGLDQLERLAEQWANVTACSFTLDIGKKRAHHIADLTRTHHADAVIFLQMMFCDVDEFDYPYIKNVLAENSIPVLGIEIQQNMQSIEPLRTRLQAFCEMIKTQM